MHMIQIRLSARRPALVGDPLGRSTVGGDEAMSEAAAWLAGRGVWRLDAERVLAEEEVQVISSCGQVLAVARITGVSKFGKRRAIEGDLVSGHQRVGEQTSTPHPSRNPVAYFEDAAIPQS